MKKYYLLILAAATAIALSFQYPYKTISPGPIQNGHKKYETRCSTCHTLFSEIDNQKCQKCHLPSQIPAVSAPQKSHLAFNHNTVTTESCIDCHKEHHHNEPTQKILNFHKLQYNKQAVLCAECHSAPKNLLHHKKTNDNCIICHNTNEWKAITYAHSLQDKEMTNELCSNCHLKPKDKEHEKVDRGCPACHAVSEWKKITSNHDPYFRLDRKHKRDCENCHINKNYSEYNCFTCHDHQEARLKSEHKHFGVSDNKKCVQCHRSSSEINARKALRDMLNKSGKLDAVTTSSKFLQKKR